MAMHDGGSTNVLAHLLGFICGVATGAIAASARGARFIESIPAGLAAAVSLTALSVAWMLAQ